MILQLAAKVLPDDRWQSLSVHTRAFLLLGARFASSENWLCESVSLWSSCPVWVSVVPVPRLSRRIMLLLLASAALQDARFARLLSCDQSRGQLRAGQLRVATEENACAINHIA